MKFRQALVVAMAGAVLNLSGCVGRGGREIANEAALLPPVEIPELTPEPQSFRTQTSFINGVLSIDVLTPDGPTRTLYTLRNLDATWDTACPRHGRSGRRRRAGKRPCFSAASQVATGHPGTVGRRLMRVPAVRSANHFIQP